MPNYYQVLQVFPNADQNTINAAYGQLVAYYGARAGTDPEAARQVALLNEAYQTLSDPVKRAQYDRDLQAQAAAPPPAPPAENVTTRSGTTVLPPPARTAGAGFPIWAIGLLGACVAFALLLACVAGFVFMQGGGPLAALLGSGSLTPQPPLGVGTLAAPTLEPTAGAPGTSEAESPTTTAPETPGTSAGDMSFITNVVMATATISDTFAPVGETTVFAPTDTFHAVVTIKDAPDGTNIRAVWYAQDVGPALAKNYKISEYPVTTSGSRNIDFTLKPTKNWPPGTYRVEIYANGQLYKSIEFSVQSASGSAGSNPIIKTTTFAKDVTPEVFDPVDPTTTFSPQDQVLHLVVTIQNAPPNTQIKASWYFGEQLYDKSTTFVVSGSRNLDFRLQQNQPWETGDYSVQLFINGKLDRTVTFSVE